MDFKITLKANLYTADNAVRWILEIIVGLSRNWSEKQTEKWNRVCWAWWKARCSLKFSPSGVLREQLQT